MYQADREIFQLKVDGDLKCLLQEITDRNQELVPKRKWRGFQLRNWWWKSHTLPDLLESKKAKCGGGVDDNWVSLYVLVDNFTGDKNAGRYKIKCVDYVDDIEFDKEEYEGMFEIHLESVTD